MKEPGKFVQEVKEEIESNKPKDWTIKIYSNDGGGLYIRNTKWKETNLRKTSNKDLPKDHLLLVNWQNIYKRSYYGISADLKHFDSAKIKQKLAGIKIEEYNRKWWPFQTDMKEADFQDPNQLKKLWEKEERTALAQDIARKLIELMKFCDEKLLPSGNSNS